LYAIKGEQALPVHIRLSFKDVTCPKDKHSSLLGDKLKTFLNIDTGVLMFQSPSFTFHFRNKLECLSLVNIFQPSLIFVSVVEYNPLSG
jgi:hypothetical protein